MTRKIRSFAVLCLTGWLAACAQMQHGAEAARDGASASWLAARKAVGLGPPEQFVISRSKNVRFGRGAAELSVEIRGYSCADAQLSIRVQTPGDASAFAHEIAYTDYMGYLRDADCGDDLEAFAFDYLSQVIETDGAALAPYSVGGGAFTPIATRETYERARRSGAAILCAPTTQLGGPCLWRDPATGAVVEIAQFAMRR